MGLLESPAYIEHLEQDIARDEMSTSLAKLLTVVLNNAKSQTERAAELLKDNVFSIR